MQQENIYEPHDVDMGIVDNFGAEVCFVRPFLGNEDCLQRATTSQKSSIPHARDRQRYYGICVDNTCNTSHFLFKEPGQARHASDGSFPTGSAFNLGGNLEIGSGSHKSSLFPWDNAGLSSSVPGAPFEMGSDRLGISIGQDDVRLKDAFVGRSDSGREGSLVPSQLNSGPGTLGFPPRAMGPHINDSFEFDGRESIARTYKLLICGYSSSGE